MHLAMVVAGGLRRWRWRDVHCTTWLASLGHSTGPGHINTWRGPPQDSFAEPIHVVCRLGTVALNWGTTKKSRAKLPRSASQECQDRQGDRRGATGDR